jgi:hypothetical protein
MDFCVWRYRFEIGSLRKPFDNFRNRFRRIRGCMDKMRFHLKPFGRMYDIELECTARSVLKNAILASYPIAPVFMF